VTGYCVAAFHTAKAIEAHYEVEGASNMSKATVPALAAAMDAYNGVAEVADADTCRPFAQQLSHRQGRL
jgi:hypothetical protein